MKQFTPAFLSGFYADTADVEAETYQREAEAIAYNNSIGTVYGQFPGISIQAPDSTMDLNTKTKSIDRTMFPVWFMSYRNGNRVAYTTINGQTGKVVTDLPVDTKKYLKGSLLLALPIFLLLNLFFTISPNILLILSAIIAAVSMVFLRYELSQIKKKDSGRTDRGRKDKQAVATENYTSIGLTMAIFAILAAVGILVLNPVSDIFYYAGAILTLVAVFVTIKDLIYYYNIMATRRLPQFDRTGGDDRA